MGKFFDRVKKYGAYAALVVSLTGMSVFALWDHLGWETPNGHRQSIAQMEVSHDVEYQALLSALEGLAIQEQTNHDNWLCDEDSEELGDLRIKIEIERMAGRPTAQLQHEEAKIVTRMTDRRCSRFL